MPTNSICITYSNPHAVYYPGTSVEGVVHLDLKESMKARSLRIAVDGRAHTHWSITKSRTVSTSRTESYTVHYSATVIYADGDTIAWSASTGSKEVLNPGSYQFPFVFRLPPNCAPSFEGTYGYIRYMVKVELDRPWRFNKTDKRLFTVVPIFDLNAIPQASMPIRESTVKSLGIVLFRHGKVSLQCDIPKTGFVPGETIVINATVVNDSSKDIVKASAKLFEVSKYVAFEHGKTIAQGVFVKQRWMDNNREQRRKIATGEQDICVEKKSKGTIQVYLQVPSTVPSFNCCPIISVEYVVEMKLKTLASFNREVGTHCHLLVGTIPVRNPYELQQPSAPPVEGFDPSTSSTLPSAPPMDTPPPYVSGDNGSFCPPPPPSYEESVKGVDGTTMDTDDIGPFVPRYPFYPQLNGLPEKSCNGDPQKT
ncbi:hypothetical protein Q1695_015482 [Nippostrongylus brasiliensis]|nr:hypothetical protein Q1695_015482 [Nippostrongylus brasiliensis]